MRTGICDRAALPQTPNQRKTWKLEAFIGHTQVKAAYGCACWYARQSYDFMSLSGLLNFQGLRMLGPMIL